MAKIKANGVELFYDLSGPEAGTVVVFSNSLGTTLAMWDAVVPALAGRYRCLRYDARGHGRSEVTDTPIAIDDLANDLAGLLDGLGIATAHVVGLSIGGMIAQAFAAAHPQRVNSLVLMSTTADFAATPALHERAQLVRRDGVEAVVEATMGRWFTAPFRQRVPNEVARVRDVFLATDRRCYAACCDAIAETDLSDRISAIAKPTLIMVGADDPATPPAMAEEIRARIAGAELVTLSDAAHLLAVEHPEAVSAHLTAFLAWHDGAGPSRDRAAYEKGLAVRKSVLGADYVEAAIAQAGDFGAPWQDFITRIAWGEIWGDPTLPRKTRSLLTLAMMVALHREEEFKLHVRPALANGVTVDEMRALTMQAAIYAGVPAANAAFRWLRDVLGEELS